MMSFTTAAATWTDSSIDVIVTVEGDFGGISGWFVGGIASATAAYVS